jgi:hypothetical protein
MGDHRVSCYDPGIRQGIGYSSNIDLDRSYVLRTDSNADNKQRNKDGRQKLPGQKRILGGLKAYL